MTSAATDAVLVYRMEDPDLELGAFAALSWDAYADFEAINPVNSDQARFPTPYNDHELLLDPNFETVEGVGVFGCCSPETLREWFPSRTIPLLENHGVEFTIWRVPADAIARSDRQAAFIRDRAELLERRPAADLHKAGALPLAA